MKIILTTILFFISFNTFAQFDYDIYVGFLSERSLQENKKLRSVTEYELKGKGRQKTINQQFNKDGLPTIIIQYAENEAVSMTKEFRYDSTGHIRSIETYKNKVHDSSTEFTVNKAGQITSYTDFVYSSHDGKKLSVWSTSLKYNTNNTIKEAIKFGSSEQDTSEINFYDGFGVNTKTLLNTSGLRTKKIEYIYNKDSTEMLEKHYEDDTTIYNTIIHKYRNKLEIEKIDSSTSPKPIYWKYDTKGNLIETNEAVYYILHHKYNSNNYLTNKIVEVLFSDSNEKDLPKRIEFKYEYEFRE